MLPKILTPEFETTIPSTEQKIRFRPFLVKEEKVLYMALEGGTPQDIYRAVVSILESCILTPGVDPTKFTSYDLEYLFLMLRAKSVGEVITVRLKHQEPSDCGHATEVSINIDDIGVEKNAAHVNKIDLGNGIGIKLRDPTAPALMSTATNQVDKTFELIYACVEYVYDKDNVYNEFTHEELVEFITSMNKDQFEKIVSFFNTLPKVIYQTSFKCEQCSKVEDVVLEGLQSFFI